MPSPMKPFLTYEQQLLNLRAKKLLIINNPSYAHSKLQDIRYYALIDGYKHLFYNSMTRQYIPGTTFEDIVSLYDFDEILRELLFKYICHFEQKIRSQISYYFCEKYSSNQGAYLTPANYNNSPKNQYGIQKLIKILGFEANINMAHDYIIYQRNTYGNVPLWVIMNTLTIGQVSKLYSFLPDSLQAKISLCYPSVNEKELKQYLKVLTDFRNVCAHNERLFSFHSHTDIPNTKLHQKLKIPQKGGQLVRGKNDVFAVVISFRYLLSKEDFVSFKKKLNSLLLSYKKQSSTAHINNLLNAMGFPSNWSNILRYKP